MAISLEKITLEKKGDTHKIDLRKGINHSKKEIVINLDWSQEPKKKNFFTGIFGVRNPIDLDLGCFYELKDGGKTVIDGLQFVNGLGGQKDQLTKQGRYSDKPWIWHSGDDRGTNSSNGENILINPVGLKNIKRIIIYCFIYEGVAKWGETDAVVTVRVPNNPDVVVEMGKQYNSQKFCAIAELIFNEEDSITVKKLITFHKGHGGCDREYEWGLKWKAGSK